MKLQISKITIGERFRKDFGNLEPLKKSIQEIGLLHPVVVNEDNVLVAGERRLRSVQELGWDEVPITRINKSEIKERLEKVVKGEHDENVVRKDFLTTEAVAIWKAMESYQGQQLPSESDGSCQRESPIGEPNSLKNSCNIILLLWFYFVLNRNEVS